MQIQVNMTPLKRNDKIVAVGIARFGDVSVKNLTLMRNSSDELFLVMPSRDCGRTDKDGKKIFEEIAHPTTKEMRNELSEAAIESYEKGRPVTFNDSEEGKMLVSVEAFDKPFYNRVGRGQLLINEKFVIKDIFVNENKSGDLYVTLPNYKTNQTGKDGKNIFSEIVLMSKEFRKEVCDAVINEYNLEKQNKAQNRFSIKSRLSEAKDKVILQEPKATPVKEAVL